MKANVVIDGKSYPMTKGDVSDHIFDFDYKLPDNRDTATFYYILNYDYRTGEKAKTRETKSDIHKFKLTNRYPVMIESNRAPTGTKLPILGRGFSRFDKVYFDNAQVTTEFISENQLNIIVPSLPAGKTYKILLENGTGRIFIDNFRIDKSMIRVVPATINILSGQVQRILFKIDNAAPSGGLKVDVTTNIPEGVIMDEVRIAEGKKTVNIPIRGGAPSKGSLFVQVPGFDEVTVPITVSPSN